MDPLLSFGAYSWFLEFVAGWHALGAVSSAVVGGAALSLSGITSQPTYFWVYESWSSNSSNLDFYVIIFFIIIIWDDMFWPKRTGGCSTPSWNSGETFYRILLMIKYWDSGSIICRESLELIFYENKVLHYLWVLANHQLWASNSIWKLANEETKNCGARQSLRASTGSPIIILSSTAQEKVHLTPPCSQESNARSPSGSR